MTIYVYKNQLPYVQDKAPALIWHLHKILVSFHNFTLFSQTWLYYLFQYCNNPSITYSTILTYIGVACQLAWAASSASSELLPHYHGAKKTFPLSPGNIAVAPMCLLGSMTPFAPPPAWICSMLVGEWDWNLAYLQCPSTATFFLPTCPQE